MRRIGCVLAACILVAAGAPVMGAETLRLRKTQQPLTYLDYEFAVKKGADGVPRMDWELFRSRPPRLVTRSRAAVVLENRYFRATLIPAMGRVRSFVHKPSGHEQLWINPAAIPIPAHNDTGFWVTWGGIECVLPRGEHGTSHALDWHSSIEENSPRRKAVRVWTVEPLTGLKHSLIYAAYPDRRDLETTITLHNPTPRPARFSHWTTAVLAPGGEGQVTPRTEFIVPAERFVAADRPFNQWMQPLLGPLKASPLRFMEAWKDIGDLMATPLRRPLYAAYSHEKDEAVVRVIDRRRTPGFNIWTWGHAPSLERQREFTAKPPNAGYVEFWNGTATDFSDEARGTLEPGATLSWVEKLCVVTGLRGSSDLVSALEAACTK